MQNAQDLDDIWRMAAAPGVDQVALLQMAVQPFGEF